MIKRLAFTGAVVGVVMSFSAAAAIPDIGRVFGSLRDAGTAVTGVDEKQEIAIGRELAGRTLGAAPLVEDPALQAYVNKVGRWVAAQSERPDLPWRFGIVDTRAVNAFAIPGGHILITRGLYEMLANESQLAGVLAHEIAHVVRRHHITMMQKSAGLSALSGFGQEALSMSGRAGVATPLANTVLGTGAEWMARGLDKNAEFEADHLGVVLAARAGYSPSGLIEVLHLLQSRPKDSDTSVLFSTHPNPGDRLTELGRLMEPRLSSLPAGQEPAIQAVAAGVAAAPATTAKPVAGARALQDQQQQQVPAGAASASPSRGGVPDPGTLLRGIFGR